MPQLIFNVLNTQMCQKCVYFMRYTCFQDGLRFYCHYINMKSSTAPKGRQSRYQLRMVGGDHVYFKGEVKVKFNPIRKTKFIARTSILPTFNNDRKPYTFSFQLPSHIPETDEQLKLDHQRRVEEAGIQISDMQMPKPRSRHKYCGVCRGHYEDYKEHIESEDHLGKLSHSLYQGLIIQLCQRVQQDGRCVEECNKLSESTCEEGLIKGLSESSLQTPQKSTIV